MVPTSATPNTPNVAASMGAPKLINAAPLKAVLLTRVVISVELGTLCGVNSPTSLLTLMGDLKLWKSRTPGS
jgi:hypothetical protein